MKLGRNEPCHCGSGKKYKKCCAAKDAAATSAELLAEAQARARAAEVETAAEAAREAAGGAKPPAPRPEGGVPPRQQRAPAKRSV